MCSQKGGRAGNIDFDLSLLLSYKGQHGNYRFYCLSIWGILLNQNQNQIIHTISDCIYLNHLVREKFKKAITLRTLKFAVSARFKFGSLKLLLHYIFGQFLLMQLRICSKDSRMQLERLFPALNQLNDTQVSHKQPE